MASGDPSAQALLKSLLRKQLKHKLLVAKVEKATARLERYKVKLQALEARIADLERNIADPRGEHARPTDGKRAIPHAQHASRPSRG